MSSRAQTSTIENPTFKDIVNLLASNPDRHYTRLEICAALGRGKTSQMVRLIEMGVDLAYLYCVVGKVNGREVFYYRINDFSDPA